MDDKNYSRRPPMPSARRVPVGGIPADDRQRNYEPPKITITNIPNEPTPPPDNKSVGIPLPVAILTGILVFIVTLLFLLAVADMMMTPF